MALFYFIILCLSALGLMLLLGVKRYEMNTGHVIFMRARPKAARAVRGATLFVQYLLPFLARRGVAEVVKLIRVLLRNTLARVTLYAEVSLRRLLTAIQQGMQPKRGGVASAFLQEVAEHKKKLLKDPEERKAFFEEVK